jgi:eukaryotic-like serine/threonine-protein kinase
VVAIKVLPPGLAHDPRRRERFEREARALSSLNHPHICRLYDVGNQDGVDYLVMELLEGQPLSERLHKGLLPLDQALAYAIQIADALDAAHRQGIVHRDLKPANIMLTKSGAKLLDFGIARAAAPVATPASAQSTLTDEGTWLGTVQYMALEQLEGHAADARSDLFSFGAVLYEMLTGRQAFPGASVSKVIAAVLDTEPAPLAAAQRAVPAPLDHLVETCLAKDPDSRWQNAGDLKRQLEWIAANPRVGDAPAITARRSSGVARAKWAGAVAASVLALVPAAC